MRKKCAYPLICLFLFLLLLLYNSETMIKCINWSFRPRYYYIFFWKMSLYKKVSNSCQTFMLLHVSSDVAVWQGFISNKWTFCSINYYYRTFQNVSEGNIYFLFCCVIFTSSNDLSAVWYLFHIYFYFIFRIVKFFCPFETFYFFKISDSNLV